MKITNPVRSAEQRRHDVLARLERETDIWVATADDAGLPCLVPLWFVWHADAVWLSTRITNPTGRNLRDGGRARLALGDTRDVVLLDGEVTVFSPADVPGPAVEALRAKTGWDPRGGSPSYAFFRIRPYAVQAWHEERELRGRHLMRDGVWAD
ncbi:pyridoxamine 5'-phosphate oxidase family protein [Streptomyces hyaluromycini]|uniref:pyridoxamine 5'-phosphate oxidase family protein n=1 Tax=Streptomyces hyaluromycini TaxID=1377993 RepID=UPI000B5C7FCC|nr:pyridoxamine 5'-phosphate oxidase family protein [Streptomyces hyaluromycini]